MSSLSYHLVRNFFLQQHVFLQMQHKEECECISMSKVKPTRYNNSNRFIHEILLLT